MWDTYVGDFQLAGLPQGQWTKVELSLPPTIKAALEGNYSGAIFRTFANTGIDGVKLRGLRFSGAEPTATRPPRVSHLQSSTNDFLSFEINGDWLSGTATIEREPQASHAMNAMRLNTAGWTEIESRMFSTGELPVISNTLTVDLFVPSPRPNPYWLGQVDAYLTCPSKGVWGAWLGHHELDKLHDSEWNTVQMPLSQSIVSVLQSGAADCSFRFTINTTQTDLAASFLIDRVGFLN